MKQSGRVEVGGRWDGFDEPQLRHLPLELVQEARESRIELRRVPRRVVDGAEGRAIVALTLEHIEEALGLPDGVRLMGVRIDAMCGVVEFRFDGPGLPPCAEGAEPMHFESLRGAWEHQNGG